MSSSNTSFVVDSLRGEDGRITLAFLLETHKTSAFMTEEVVAALQRQAIVAPAEPAEPAAAASEPAPAPASAPVPKPRKAKVTKTSAALVTENELLIPVDAAPVVAAPVVAAPVVPAAKAPTTGDDPLRGSKYRLQNIDATLCMGRKIDEKNPIVGTRKGDPGANGMFWPELQCQRKPNAGSALCKFCSEKDSECKAGKPHKQWYGRLDESIYANAKVVGCEHFFTKYPKGLKGAEVEVEVEADVPVAVPVAATPEPTKPAKKRVTKKAATVVPESTLEESVAAGDETPIVIEWMTMLHKGRPVIRNLKTDKVYEVNPHKTSHEEMVLKDKCIGRWTDGTIDPYGADDDE